ncbi:GNAT family N-acetyltransferase [Atopococcus tabaci]|uniref:GNAT family N-acetyltransferase n=1 Tax=Atopococcus tabaci TaxID=269774 RepID=UPI000427AFA4|nr:GNAT family N-acetyltransferase [Atopococcus tabaci]
MFETKRCSIHAFKESDSAEVKKLYLNHEVRKYLGGIRKEEAVEAVLDDMLHSSEDSYYWVVREKHTDYFIGLISIDPHHDGTYVEISYQFLPDWWGRGYATETVGFILRVAFTELNLSKVIAETQTANVSSRKLLERLGMKLERTTTRFGAEQAIYSIER